jgi:hypothetical protein
LLHENLPSFLILSFPCALPSGNAVCCVLTFTFPPLKRRDMEVEHLRGFEVLFLPTTGKKLPRGGEENSPPRGAIIPKYGEVCYGVSVG